MCLTLSKYGRSIFDSELDIISDINISQYSNREFEIKGIKYLIDEKDLDDPPSQIVDAHSKDPNPSPFKCNLDMTKVQQLQQQDTDITEIDTRCKSKKWDKIFCYFDEHGIGYQKMKNGSNIFHAIIVPQPLKSDILNERHNA